MLQPETVTFAPDTIQAKEKSIAFPLVKALDAQLGYQGQPRSSRFSPLRDGTGNWIQVVYHDGQEKSIAFFVYQPSDLQHLQRVLTEAKHRHHVLLVL